jgi:hypothetical protein
VTSLDLTCDGAGLHRAALDAASLSALLAHCEAALDGGAGTRLFGDARLGRVLGPEGALGRIAREQLGEAARPVRAVLFDKTPANNWAVAWHQDRTVAVRERREVAGFGPWSTKAGVPHVEPPFAVIEGMLTLRAHLDPCGETNSPLWIAPGSHRLGRVPSGEAAETARRLEAVACLADVGDVWAYSTSILHASERAAEPARRRVLQVDYAAADLPGGLEWLGVG